MLAHTHLLASVLDSVVHLLHLALIKHHMCNTQGHKCQTLTFNLAASVLTLSSSLTDSMKP